MRIKSFNIRWQQRCELCLSNCGEALLCHACETDLPWLGHHCQRCALPITKPSKLCGHCLVKPPPWRQVLTPFIYQFPTGQWIQALKFNQQLHLTRIMAHYMSTYIKEHSKNLPDLLIPVPLHTSRLRERGFNQSQQLAQQIGRNLNVPIHNGIARRVRHAPPQSSLNRRQRFTNLRRAFNIEDSQEILKNKQILLIDDVMTTGTTARVLSHALQRAKVANTDIAVFARAI